MQASFFNTDQRIDSLRLIPTLFTLILICVSPAMALAAEHEHHNTEAHEHKAHSEEPHKHHEDEHNSHSEESNHHEGHEEPELIFTAEQLTEFSIKLTQAGSGVINSTLTLMGEVIVEPERLYHVVPRVSGVVLQAFKQLGDRVKEGDLLATLSSRDLADAKVQFIAADSLLKLSNKNMQREHQLYKGNVSSKRKYLAAKQEQAEMLVKRNAAKQRLLALGLTKNSIHSVLQDADKDLTLYLLRAPADGIIIEKHAVQGEVLETNTRSFTLADLSRVWVNLTVYQKDLPLIHQGQQVQISTRFGMSSQEISSSSSIGWLSPTLEEKTRSATARVVIDNPDGNWRPGLFVSAQVAIAKNQVDIVAPLTALQTIDGQTIIFVEHEPGEFEAQPVVLGRRDFKQVEILQGLKPGQTYVSHNAFALKAQLQKGSFGHGHSH